MMMHQRSMFRGRRVALLAILVAVAAIATGDAIAQPGRVPVPPLEAQQRAEAEIRQLLEGEINLEPATHEAAAEAADRLVELARGTQGDSAARFVLYQMAIGLAVDAAAPGIIHEQGAIYANETELMTVRVMRTIQDRWGDSLGGEQHAEMREALRRVIDVATRLKRFDIVEEGRAVLASLPNATGQVHRQEKPETRPPSIVEPTTTPPTEAEAKEAALRVLQHPDDASARRIVGVYLALVKGDFDAGLPHLAKSDDPHLAPLAQEELRSAGRASALVVIGDAWRQVAGWVEGVMQRHASQHAEALYRRAYPEIAGLDRLRLEKAMRSRPLLSFDSDNPPARGWVDEHFAFSANHVRTGPGSWADYQRHDGDWLLVANKAGYVSTVDHFPPEGVEHWRIEAELWSDLKMGTALEFAGRRLYFGGAGGIHLESGWIPPVTHPITSGRYHTYVIDVTPGAIEFTVDGERLGAMEIDEVSPGPITLRGWEGHVRCRRLVVWAMPEDEELVSSSSADDDAGGANDAHRVDGSPSTSRRP